MNTDGLMLAPWVRTTHRLYFGSLIAWSVGFALVVVAHVVVLLNFRGGSDVQVIYAGLMLLALPGLLYFYLFTRKMLHTDEAQAQQIFSRVMVVQHVTGIVAMAGAVLGFLPFAANMIGLLTIPFEDPSLPVSDFWPTLASNAGMFIPWISLYGFVVTYIVALVINRRRKSEIAAQPRA